jgi:hypothetical protein
MACGGIKLSGSTVGERTIRMQQIQRQKKDDKEESVQAPM